MKSLNFVSRHFHQRMALALLLTGFVTFVCASSQAVPADDVITIGVVLPTTGSESKPGTYQKEGIELAIKQINDAGGIMVKSKGKKLKINEIFYDDSTDSKKSASLTERAMSSDAAVAVIGGYFTAPGTAGSLMAERHQNPRITPPAGASPLLHHNGSITLWSLS